MSEREAVISCRGLLKTYQGPQPVPVLRGIDLQIHPWERQGCDFARTEVTETACVLADEPTGNLNSHTAEEVLDAMLRLSASHGTAFIIVTHDPGLAAKAERVMHLKDGVIHAGATP